MSVIDELLVLLDEGRPLTLEQIKKKLPERTLQTISSTLGRLEAKGWLKISKEKKVDCYQITSSGQEEITRNLAEIRKNQDLKWDGGWQIVVFEIPEKIRAARDLFRLYLKRLGYGRVRGSFWISCWKNDQKLAKIIDDLGIRKYLSIINLSRLSEKDQKIILDKLEWDWKSLNRQYKEFLGQATRFFLTPRKDTFSAKRLIYRYAKILKNDPCFPPEIQIKGYLGNKVRKVYQKIRPYCYK